MNNIALMSPDLWGGVKDFSMDENWGVPGLMDAGLVYGLQRLRDYVGRSITIHCGYERRTAPSYHNRGGISLAVDFDIEGLHVVDQFIAATRLDVFNGIGVYPWWNRPGIHADRRDGCHRNYDNSLWGSTGPGKYVKLDRTFIQKQT